MYQNHCKEKAGMIHHDVRELIAESKRRQEEEESNLAETVDEPLSIPVGDCALMLSALDDIQKCTSAQYSKCAERIQNRYNISLENVHIQHGIRVVEPLALCLSKNEISEVEEWFCSNRKDPYSVKFGYQICQRDLNTLREGNWLNDNIINCFVHLAKEEAEEEGIKIYCFNSFFFTKLRSNGYSSVRRWTKNVDIFSYNRIIIPINTNNTHWTMSYIDVDKKEIHYCDSMGGTGKRILEELVGYLREEMKDKKGEVLSEETWSMIDSGRSVPQQENFTDCGVFTCLNCLFCCLRRPLNYSQKMIPMFRKYIAYCIVQGKIR